MIPRSIIRKHVLAALKRIDQEGVPGHRVSRKYLLVHGHKTYPPKYTLALAAEEVGLGQLDPESYGGGAETNSFLAHLGFKIDGARGDSKEVQRALDLLWRIESQLQWAKLLYLRWVTHPKFNPPKRSVAWLKPGDMYKVLFAYNGNAFTLSPCGWGAAYQGGGNGCVKLPRGVYPNSASLKSATFNTKHELANLTGELRKVLIQMLANGEKTEIWALLQDLYWIKMGIHEFECDLTYRPGSEVSVKSVRDLLVTSLRHGKDLRRTRKVHGFSDTAVEKFIRGFQWHRYSCCAFDAGPIVVGKSEFVRYAVIARSLRRDSAWPPYPGKEEEDGWKQKARRWAQGELAKHYDVIQSFWDPPFFTGRGSNRWGSWSSRRTKITSRLNKIEASLKARQPPAD